MFNNVNKKLDSIIEILLKIDRRLHWIDKKIASEIARCQHCGALVLAGETHMCAAIKAFMEKQYMEIAAEHYLSSLLGKREEKSE